MSVRPAVTWLPLFLACSVALVAAARSTTTWITQHGGHRFEVRIEGDVELDDEGAAVARLAPDALLVVEERGRGRLRRAEVRPGPDGEPVVEYQLGSRAADFDEDARAWLADMLGRTSLGARARAARLLEREGPDAVLVAARQPANEPVADVYLRALVESDRLDPPTGVAVARQAGERLSSSSSQESVLVALARRLTSDAALTRALIQATTAVSSSSAQESVLVTVVRSRDLDDEAVRAVADAVSSVASSSSQESVLVALARARPGDPATVAAVAGALPQVASSSSQEAVLLAACAGDLTDEAAACVARGVGEISSSSSQEEVLVALARAGSGSDAFVAAFARAVAGVSSSSSQESALLALLDEHELSPAGLASVRSAADSIASSSAREAVLRRAAARTTGPR